jgi:SAM-dependent methyltransferase
VTNEKDDDMRRQVRQAYGAIAVSAPGGGCAPSCCTPGGLPSSDVLARGIGYSEAELAAVPEGANLGLGCGNPQAIAALQTGETVLDLGSGGGFDCFLAARQVGEVGRVIGVDMTPDMLSKARANAANGGFANVEFRLGEIEHLPVADACIDVILSNCVINLSPDKPQVFREAFRVLRPGGRLALSDTVALAPLPEALRDDPALYTGCIAGAPAVEELREWLAAAGFVDVRIAPKGASAEFIAQWAAGQRVEDYVAAATIEARKPAGPGGGS